MTTKILDLYSIEQKLFWIFSCAIMLLSAWYVYSAFSLTVNVVERNTMSRSAQDLEFSVSNLEIEYMKIQNSLTMAHAKSIGFEEVSPKFTVETPPKISLVR